jgi:hypothetical protein
VPSDGDGLPAAAHHATQLRGEGREKGGTRRPRLAQPRPWYTGFLFVCSFVRSFFFLLVLVFNF